MADLIDPETLLDWLQNGVGEDREVQLMALEQLCMLLLMSDNIDRCFESCPPRTFLPALCRIFQDEDAPPQILEVTARAITYYLDVSAECTRRIVAVDGAVKAICRRLSVAEMHSRTGKDLAEQCMKVLEFICTREATSVFDAGGLQSALAFVRSHASVIHKDTLHSSMAVITRLCGKLEPGDASLSECVQSLSSLLYHEDAYVCEAAVRCFAAIAERYMRKGADPAPLAQYGLVEYLLGCLRTYGHHQSSSVAPSSAQSTPVQPSKSGAGSASATPATPGTGGDKSASSVSLVISLLSTLCRASGTVTRQLLESDLSSAVENTIYKDERCCLDTIRLVDLLLVLLFEGRKALPKFASVFAAAAAHRQSSYGGVAISRSESERAHRQLIDVIRARDNEAFRILMDQGRIDVNFMDDVGQTLLNWASAFGTAEMVDYLCQRGADVNRGQRSSSLHYAACFGRPNVAKILLRFGANTDLRDEDGKTALERSRERADQGHRDVCAILESPAEWLSSEESSALAFSSPLAAAAAAPKLPTPPVAQHPAAASVVVGAKRNRSPGFVVSISNDPALRGRRTVTATPAEPPPAQESPQAEDLDSSLGNQDDEVENSPPTPVPEDTIGSPQTPKVVEEPIPEEPLDAALATKYVGRFLPMFCRLYQHSLMTTVRRGSLGLIKKLVRYAEPDALCGICRENHFAEQMVEVLSLVLDTEEDEDSQAGVLTVMQDLLAKNKVFFLEHFARLGIFEKVLALTKLQVGPTNAMDSPLTPRTLGVDTAIPFSSTALTATPTGYRAHPRGGDLGAVAAAPVQEDAREIDCDVAYHWKDWCIVRGRDCVYMWNEMIALELSNGSNGWFRFIVDSKLGTMYSSGSPEGGSDGSENRSEFLDKLQRARSSLKPGVVSIPILSAPSAVSIVVANWVLESSRAGELYLKNVDGPQQTVLLREDSPSFEFVDNRGVKHVLTAETALGAQFPNWSGSLGRPKPKRVKSRTEVQLAKVVTLAKELYETYFADAQCNFPMQEVMINLQKLVDRFSGLVEAAKSGQEVHGKSFKEALIELKRLLSDEQALSSYELYSSGIIPVLNAVFALAKSNPGLSAIFSEVYAGRQFFFIVMFSSAAGSYDEDSNVGPLSTIVLLVRKLVAALELVETLPLYAYDGTGSAFGLQLLIRRLRFRLERARGETRLLDQSGKCLKMEPLATVGQLRRHLSKVVAKQWYDQERATFQFLKILKESPCGLTFEYQKDFDENGVIYWIGTNGRTVGEWINPAQYGIVQVSSSEGRTLPYGRVEDILSRDNCSLNCHTQDDKKAWFTIDLGLYLIPSAYTLRHARGYARSALRNWLFLGSQDGSKWTTIYVHMEETRLNEPGSTATWVLNPPPSDEKGWRYFRIQQNGKNSSGQTHYLSLSGFEIYGVVTEPAIDMNSASKTPSDPNAKKQPRRSQRQRYNNLNLSAAVRTVRGGMVPAESLWKYAPNELSRAAAGDVAGARSGENVQNANTGSSSLYQFAASGESSDFELAYAAMQSQEAALQALHALTVRPQAAAAAPAGGGAQHHTPLSRTLRAMAAHKSGGGRGSFGRPPGESNASVLTSRKSMSTTNLFEVSDDPDRGVSVASTEQAASADNLRNHTPSLENLLARSRLREESMPLTFSGMRLMPESIAESRVEDLAMSGSTSDETLAGPGIPLMDIDQAIAELGGEGGGEITPRLEEAGLMDHDAQVAENVAQAIVSQASQESGMFLPTPPPPPPPAASFPPAGDGELPAQFLTSDGRSLFESSDAALASLHGAGGDQMTAAQFWSGGGEAAIVQAAVRQRLTNLLLSEKNNSFILEQLAGGSNELIDVAASDVANNVRNSLASLSVSAPNLSLANNSSTTRRDSASTDTSTNSGVRTKPTNSVSFCDSETFEGIVQFAINQELNAMGGIIPSSAQSFPSLSSAVAPPVTASHGIAQQSSHVLVNSMGQPLTMMSLVSTSSDSEADFVEASSGKILADVEDDEIAEVEDHENEDDNGEEDYTSEELLEAVIAGRRRNWDEDMVLKAAIPAMIPAFDPRPGRTNINQTSDVEVPRLVNEALDAVQRSVSVESADSRSLRLQVHSPGLSSAGDAVLSLDDPDRPIFYYVQKLIQQADARGKSEKSRQLWDATYVVAYSSQAGEPVTEILVQIDDCPATPSASQGSAVTTSGVSDPQGKRSGANLAETLGLLSSLHSFHVQNVEAEARAAILEHPGMFFPDNEYIAKKLSLKLVQQLQDPLVVSCTALPDWCDRLVYGYPMLFPFELRQQYFQATAFGMTRAVVWLQEQRDKLFEPATRSAKREEMHEYRVGRIKHERVKAPRSSEQLLPWAETLMIFHADHKAILEIEFENEEGTGLGPTLEFYALFAAELQRKALAMWVCDDDDPFAHHHPRRLSDSEDPSVTPWGQVDLGQGAKPHGYYVRSSGGLFPAAYPQDHPAIGDVLQRFYMLGIFIGKVLLDNRLVDLPLSQPMLKLLVAWGRLGNKGSVAMPTISAGNYGRSGTEAMREAYEDERGENWNVQEKATEPHWLSGLLNIDDLEVIDSQRARFLKDLAELSERRKAILADESLTGFERKAELKMLRIGGRDGTHVDDLGLTFQLNPNSKALGYKHVNLCAGGHDIPLIDVNIDEYVELSLKFYLDVGIQRQMDALRDGINRVLPAEKLSAFSAQELQVMLSGEQCPVWSEEDIIAFTEPKLGYSRDSPGFLRFVEVLVEMDVVERKAFLQFATGCSSLPPGGLANLYPRLTIVRKVDTSDDSFPSVNTCVHYLKLPEYSSKEILRERLLAATKERGFHLN